ncbi:MAG: YraN family protein [Candidatus Omnitrophica bacterium]|nr:YraN family protein [Candidatus Omnitrophota bacterium]
MGRKDKVGSLGEATASRYLRKRGYRIIEANFRTPMGEIDLVARLKRMIVFVEVKTRSTGSFGPPYLSVTKRKERHIINNALYYLNSHDMMHASWRIDIVSIRLNVADEAEDIEIFENAIEDPYI